MPMRICSQKFLQALVSDLTAIRNEYLFNYKKMSKPAVKSCLQKIYEECERLVLYPELFADDTSADKFFSSTERLSGHIVRIIAAWKRRIRRQKALVKALTNRHQKRSRRHFAKGRKPWQQFLGRNAPGSGTGIRAPSRNMSCQIMPWAGVRILCSWSKECKEIMRSIEDVSPQRPQIRRYEPTYQHVDNQQHDGPRITQPVRLPRQQSRSSELTFRRLHS